MVLALISITKWLRKLEILWKKMWRKEISLWISVVEMDSTINICDLMLFTLGFRNVQPWSQLTTKCTWTAKDYLLDHNLLIKYSLSLSCTIWLQNSLDLPLCNSVSAHLKIREFCMFLSSASRERIMSMQVLKLFWNTAFQLINLKKNRNLPRRKFSFRFPGKRNEGRCLKDTITSFDSNNFLTLSKNQDCNLSSSSKKVKISSAKPSNNDVRCQH